MKLTTTQLEWIIEKLEKYPRSPTCVVCGEENWSIQETILELREFHGSSAFHAGGVTYPMVAMNCPTCGNTILMNAIAMGVVDQKTGKLSTSIPELAHG